MTLRLTVISGLDRVATLAAARSMVRGDARGRVVTHCIDQVHVGLVSRTIESGEGLVWADVVDLAHGCVSCTLREDVLPTLRRLAADPDVDRAVLVLPEAVEPIGFLDNYLLVVADDGSTTAEVCSLDAVVAVVEPGRLIGMLTDSTTLQECGFAVGQDDDREVAEVLVGQIECADVIVATGTTLQQRSVISLLNPQAQLLEQIPTHIDPMFDFTRTNDRTIPAHVAEHSPDCRHGEAWRVHWRTDRPMHPLRLLAALDQVGEVSLRGRGYLHVATRPSTAVEWDSAGRQLRLGAPDLDVAGPGARLTFVGVDVRSWIIRDALDAAVLTDAEMAHAAEEWRALGDPFIDIWHNHSDAQEGR